VRSKSPHQLKVLKQGELRNAARGGQRPTSAEDGTVSEESSENLLLKANVGFEETVDG